MDDRASRRTVITASGLIAAGLAGCVSAGQEDPSQDDSVSTAASHCDHTVEDGDSIQAAINAADDGDVICIEPGTYEEALNISGVDSLTLDGAGPDQVTIDASGQTGYGIDGVFSSSDWGSDVVLRGFTLLGPRQGTAAQNFGLKLSYIDGLTVEDVHVTESRRTGVDVFPATNVSLHNVSSTNNDANGIAIRNSSDITVNNAMTDGNAWGGFAFYAPGEESVDNVVISNSTFQNEQAGIYLQHTDHTNIRIQTSFLLNNVVGLAVEENVDGGEISANYNHIVGNSVSGVISEAAGELDATCNWWGAANGPSGEGDGDGDAVTTEEGATVVFTPWSETEQAEESCTGGIEPDPLAVETRAATAVNASSATLNAELTEMGEREAVKVFFEWREVGAPEWIATDKQHMTESGSFSGEITGLTAGSEYEFRAAAKAKESKKYGDTLQFSKAEETEIFWQVDFGAGKKPPLPPRYWPNDGVFGLGSSNGVTQNPSLRRMQTDGQLGDVTIENGTFSFDDDGTPTEVTIEFSVNEGGSPRYLHLAVFTLPGPFDEDEIDEQELYQYTSAEFEGGDSGTFTLDLPQS